MRIVLVGQAYFRPDNGQATFTVQLAEGLAKANHTVLVLAPSEAENSYRKDVNGVILQTVKTIRLPHNANMTIFQSRKIDRFIREFDPQVVHIQDHYFLSRAAIVAARKYGYLLLGTNHFLPENLLDNFRVPSAMQPAAEKLLWSQMLAVYRQLDAVTAPSRTAVRILEEQGLTVPLQPISCGVDLTRYHPRNEFDWEAMRQKYGLDPQKNLFVYVGRVDREKDIQIIVRALAQLDRDDIQFGIAGKGSYFSDLREEIDELGLLTNGRVVMMGFVPDVDLPLLLNSADVFAMPSPAELLSIASLEAMASGLPVIAADAQALPELVEHKINGYLFPPGDVDAAAEGLAWLADRPGNWMSMCMTSIQRSYDHSLERIVAEYAEWYTEQYYQAANVWTDQQNPSAVV